MHIKAQLDFMTVLFKSDKKNKFSGDMNINTQKLKESKPRPGKLNPQIWQTQPSMSNMDMYILLYCKYSRSNNYADYIQFPTNCLWKARDIFWRQQTGLYMANLHSSRQKIH